MRQRMSDIQAIWRGVVMLDPPQSGETNMAIDEALIRNAKPEWPIVMRVYEWDRPTLSLGHFQSLSDRDADARLRELPWVRRMTGGGAIVHDHEITYSILIPDRHETRSKGHSEILYRAIHESVAEGLRTLGWKARMSEECTCSSSISQKTVFFQCFLRRSPVDLIVGGYKVLGSAQRRTAAGLLQHGSLLIHHSPTTPKVLGLVDLINQSAMSEKANPVGFTENQGAQMSLRRFNNSYAYLSGESLMTNQDVQFQREPEWTTFLVTTLKQGVARLFQCEWEKANESNFPDWIGLRSVR